MPLHWLQQRAAAAIFSIGFEFMRCHVQLNAFKSAIEVLNAPTWYPVPVFGPLLCTTLGGCGGGFLPASIGLAPLDRGVTWRLGSAFLFAAWLQFSVQDPHGRKALDSLGYDEAICKAAGILAVVAVPLLGLIMPGFDPLGPNPITAAVHQAARKGAPPPTAMHAPQKPGARTTRTNRSKSPARAPSKTKKES